MDANAETFTGTYRDLDKIEYLRLDTNARLKADDIYCELLCLSMTPLTHPSESSNVVMYFVYSAALPAFAIPWAEDRKPLSLPQPIATIIDSGELSSIRDSYDWWDASSRLDDIFKDKSAVDETFFAPRWKPDGGSGLVGHIYVNSADFPSLTWNNLAKARDAVVVIRMQLQRPPFAMYRTHESTFSKYLHLIHWIDSDTKCHAIILEIKKSSSSLGFLRRVSPCRASMNRNKFPYDADTDRAAVKYTEVDAKDAITMATVQREKSIEFRFFFELAVFSTYAIVMAKYFIEMYDSGPKNDAQHFLIAICVVFAMWRL